MNCWSKNCMHRKLTAWWADSHRHHVAAFCVSAEQYCLGAAFGSCKITLLRTIRIEIQDPLICDIGVFAAHARRSHQLLRGKQDHLATWRSGWNLNYKGVKLKTKSMSPLKPAWPFPLHPFRLPLTGSLGARGLGLCHVHGPVLEAGANWLFAWSNWEPSISFPWQGSKHPSADTRRPTVQRCSLSISATCY